MWIRCSFEIEARQGNRIYSRSIPRFASFKAATIFTFALFLQSRNRPVGIMEH